MRVYKVVPVQGRVVGKTSSEAVANIENFANIIIRESVGGWELIGTMPILVSTTKDSAFGEPYNAMIFAREQLKEVPKGSALEKQMIAQGVSTEAPGNNK